MGLLAGLFLYRQLVFLNTFVLTFRAFVPLMPGGFAIFLFNWQFDFFLAFPATEVNVFIPLVPVWLASCGNNVSVTVLRTLPVALVLRVVPLNVAVLVRFGVFIEVTVRNVALPVAPVFSFVPLVVTALSGCGFWFEQTIFDRTVPLTSCPVEVVTFSWGN